MERSMQSFVQVQRRAVKKLEEEIGLSNKPKTEALGTLCASIGIDPSAAQPVETGTGKSLIENMVGDSETPGTMPIKVLKIRNYGKYKNAIGRNTMVLQITQRKSVEFLHRFLIWQHLQMGNEAIHVKVLCSSGDECRPFYAVFDNRYLPRRTSWEEMCRLGEFPMVILGKGKLVRGKPVGWRIDAPAICRSSSSLHAHFATAVKKVDTPPILKKAPTNVENSGFRKDEERSLNDGSAGEGVKDEASNEEIDAKLSWLDDKGLVGKGVVDPYRPEQLIDQIKSLYRTLLQTGTADALHIYQKEELHDIYYVQEYIDVQQYLVIREPPLLK